MTEPINIDALLARGMYSTVRQDHENLKKQLSGLCGELMRLAPKINKCGQGNEESDLAEAFSKVEEVRDLADSVESKIEDMRVLLIQRADLKQKAWK
jgi:uncharacterized coiled-coil DUF342 family protein